MKRETMPDNSNIGYTEEEYYQISDKQGLPKKCPILGKCCRAVQTRYEMGMRLGGNDISFDEFLHSYGQKWDPDNMIESIEQISWQYIPDVLTSVKNVCPEVTLFENDLYLPFKFRQSAFGEASYSKESRKFEAKKKHYSECAEFAEYSFHKGKTTQAKCKRLTIGPGKKFDIFKRDGFRCDYCKRDKDALPEGVYLTLDHKVPHSAGGDDSFENLVTACSECNSGKSNKVII